MNMLVRSRHQPLAIIFCICATQTRREMLFLSKVCFSPLFPRLNKMSKQVSENSARIFSFRSRVASKPTLIVTCLFHYFYEGGEVKKSTHTTRHQLLHNKNKRIKRGRSFGSSSHKNEYCTQHTTPWGVQVIVYLQSRLALHTHKGNQPKAQKSLVCFTLTTICNNLVNVTHNKFKCVPLFS